MLTNLRTSVLLGLAFGSACNAVIMGLLGSPLSLIWTFAFGVILIASLSYSTDAPIPDAEASIRIISGGKK